LFARLELADDVIVRATSGARSIDCRGADVGPAESNVAYRAAVAYADATGWPGGFAIEIDKRIPVGGGLGGGSADAGAVLRALNMLAPDPLPTTHLLEIAGTLGADVPFMTLASPLALAWGRGDRMVALPPLPSLPVSLVTFPFGVSSGEAYAWLAEVRGGRIERVPARALSLEALGDWATVAALAANDFEVEVTRRHPPIATSLTAARGQGALIAQLSGSGSTVFVIGRPGTPVATAGQPAEAVILDTRTAFSVEDVVVTP
jgi:4-diphosphocytidyl-2-C-methyl-D-erythritol kinase